MTCVVLGIAFPLLMKANHEPFDATIICLTAGFIVAGIWWYAYFARYAVTIGDDGLTVDRLGRAPLVIAWRDVVSARTNEKGLVLSTTDGRKVTISGELPGYAAVEAAAARHLPPVVFGPGGKPIVEPEIVDPEQRRLRTLAMREWWLRTAGRIALSAVVIALAAFLADLVFTRFEFRELPRAVRVVLIYILAFVKVFGYRMSVVMLGLAILFAIMGLQEHLRLRRPPKPI